MKIGILTAGGDCPGINAAIRGVGKTAISEYGMKLIGISSGFRGLVDKEYVELEENQLSGILTLGGTILGTSRDKPFKNDPVTGVNMSKIIKKNYKEIGLDALVVIGGNGTQKTAAKLAAEGLNIIGLPQTHPNNLFTTNITFPFHTSLHIPT